MDKIIEEKKEIIKKRKYAEKFTIGRLEKADIPIEDFKKLTDKNRVSTTGDFRILRLLANAMMIEGDHFTEDTPFEELTELADFQKHFLAKSRLNSAKETLKQKRSPNS